MMYTKPDSTESEEKDRRFDNRPTLGFKGGDANLYRYVGNNVTNSVDPTGLWAWKLDAEGKILVISEANDTLKSLVEQGYPKNDILTLGKANGIEKPDAKLQPGIELDITSLFPKAIQEVLARQQQMSFEIVRGRVESNILGPKNIPKGKTVGNCGVNWFQPYEQLPDGRDVLPYSDSAFGYGNCYGFVALFHGYRPAAECPNHNFALGGLKGEGFASYIMLPTKPTIVKKDYGKAGHGVAVGEYPGGLFKLLTGKGTKTNNPTFGDVVLFEDMELGYTHAGIVLGKRQDGKVVIIQKLNQACPYGISALDHPIIKDCGNPTFYNR